MLLLFTAKAEAIPLRLIGIVRQFPRRLIRLGRHLPGIRRAGILFWTAELFLLLLELAGINELYETLADLLKPNTRPLTPREQELLLSVFGNSIRYRLVRIDERAWIGPPQMKICYVSFHHINSWGPMDDATLVHEMVHVWQYQQMGSVYISRALRAQHSAQGYDYGGIRGLEARLHAGEGLESFNLEQQAEIVADYYRLSHGGSARRAWAEARHLSVYEHFAGQIRAAATASG